MTDNPRITDAMVEAAARHMAELNYWIWNQLVDKEREDLSREEREGIAAALAAAPHLVDLMVEPMVKRSMQVAGVDTRPARVQSSDSRQRYRLMGARATMRGNT